jgi:transcription termination/antitermination protein NusA
MKTEFMVAITQLSAEKNLSKEVVLAAVESALVSAYKKNSFSGNQDITVKIDPNTGGVKVFVKKEVVEHPASPSIEISLTDAKKLDKNIKVGEFINIEATPPNAGRIAAQTARQVILQRLHEAEHHAIFEEFTCREDDVITGMVQRITPDYITVDLGKAEAILPLNEQVHNERYRVGQRMKFYLLEVSKTGKGPQIILSRSHRNLLRRLFELEVPEIHSGAVELRAVAREAGFRSKVAVAARQEGIDPVGCCVGLRGIRIQNIVNELNDEKIDVVQWYDDSKLFISNALSPAQVATVELNEADGTALVAVPDKQLSLAIGKEGQNARLAAKLTGWRIDIKSQSAYEAEKAALRAAAIEEEAVAPAVEEEAASVPAEAAAETAPVAEAAPDEAPAATGMETMEEDELLRQLLEEEELKAQEAAEEEEEPEEQEEATLDGFEFVLATDLKSSERSSQIRFAEDILPSRGDSGRRKSGKKGAEKLEGKAKHKKVRPKKESYGEEEEFS